jgi:DNA-binding MarR family transcriptional regulator
VVTRLARRLRQQGETAASPTQLAALATIERDGPLTLGELAAVERVQPPTITAAVGRLEQRGLVQRRTDTSDRRVARVEITPLGRQLLEQSRSRKTAYLERKLTALSTDERDTLERAAAILERILEHDHDEGRP